MLVVFSDLHFGADIDKSASGRCHLAVAWISLDAVGVHAVVGVAVGVRYLTALDRLPAPGTGRG